MERTHSLPSFNVDPDEDTLNSYNDHVSSNCESFKITDVNGVVGKLNVPLDSPMHPNNFLKK